MTETQLTQCPHCKASFKVSDEQLSIANGRVRCGACLNIFDAIAYRISPTPVDTHDEESFEENPFGSEMLDLEEELLSTYSETATGHNELRKDAGKSAEEDALFADDPDEDKLEKGYAGSTKLSDDFNTTFLEIGQSSGDPFGSESALDQSLIESDDLDRDERWAASILEDLDKPDSHKLEPGFSLSDEPQPETNELNYDLALSTSSAHAASRIEQQKSSLASNSLIKNSELQSLNFQYDQDPSPKHKWLVWSLLLIINIGLLLLLIAQASWYHYEKLVRYPNVAQIYAFACEKLSCTLPELSDVSKIESRQMVVKSHPTIRNALIIETIITNKADFLQNFPDIGLSFSDINNQIVAQRLFAPEEYLNEEVFAWPGMPVKQPIQITLEIMDPGPQAVNYDIKFYRPKAAAEMHKP